MATLPASVPFLYPPGYNPIGWYHPQLGRVFPFQFADLYITHPQTHPEFGCTKLLGISYCGQVDTISDNKHKARINQEVILIWLNIYFVNPQWIYLQPAEIKP